MQLDIDFRKEAEGIDENSPLIQELTIKNPFLNALKEAKSELFQQPDPRIDFYCHRYINCFIGSPAHHRYLYRAIDIFVQRFRTLNKTMAMDSKHVQTWT